jgi:hypothetical protein
MIESIGQWLMGLVNNSLFVAGLLLIFVATFLKNEQSVQSSKIKPATLGKKTFNPLPTWAYKTLIILGIFFVFVGALQMGNNSDIPKYNSLFPKSVDIESFPVKVFNYDGLQDTKVNQGTAELSISYQDKEVDYLFDYSLPVDGSYGYAGLVFRFNQNQDLSKYKNVRVVVEYLDNSSICQLYINDSLAKGNFYRLDRANMPEGVLKIEGTEYSYDIPLASFVNPNFKIIYEIGLSVDTGFTTGGHRIILKQITFTR